MKLRRFGRNVQFTALIAVVLVTVVTTGCCCCNFGPAMQAARDAAKRAQSMNNMKMIIIGLVQHADMNGQWPDSLDEVAMVGDDVMTNPVTLDYPGYEYVKPPEDAALSETIVLYQLRDGFRDESMAVGYGDGRVVDPDSEFDDFGEDF